MNSEVKAPFTRYEYTRWNKAPVAKEFVRETDAFLIDYRERRTKKRGSYSSWHETREEVEAMIAARLQREADQDFARLVGANAKELVEALESAMNRLQCGCEVPHYGGLPITSEARCDECKAVAALLSRIRSQS